MSLKLRKTTLDPVQAALVNEVNALRDALVGTTYVHGSATAGGAPVGDPPVVPAPSLPPVASDAPTSYALANALFGLINTHFADAYAHKSALSAPIDAGTFVPAKDITTLQARTNAIRAAYVAHIAQANVHFLNDAVNTIAAPVGTDQTTLNTLLNELRTKLPLHIAAAMPGQHIELIPA